MIDCPVCGMKDIEAEIEGGSNRMYMSTTCPRCQTEIKMNWTYSQPTEDWVRKYEEVLETNSTLECDRCDNVLGGDDPSIRIICLKCWHEMSQEERDKEMEEVED